MLINPDERMLPKPGDQEYRCTLPELYPMGPGKTDPNERQGYYFFAKDEEEAEALMRRRFPTAKEIHVERFVPAAELKEQKK